MELRVNLREANQHLSRYVRAVEAGRVVVITRRGRPMARLVPEPSSRQLTEEQSAARERTRQRMVSGYSLDGGWVDRDAGERHARVAALVDEAVDLDCVLTLQALSEFFAAVTRKGKMPVRDAPLRSRTGNCSSPR